MTPKPIRKILIANRGEIAVRIKRTCDRLGIATVSVYGEADRHMPHVNRAEQAVLLGPSASAESYLRADKLIEAALLCNADAVHPGYGFLSENAAFAELCLSEGLVFIGPTPQSIRQMGSKIAAKDLMGSRGIPTVPGYQGQDQSLAVFQDKAAQIGYPVLLKASAGGGGKGMRIVRNPEDFSAAFASASRESLKSFGDATLLLEKYFDSVRHIEFQIFGDNTGHVLHLFERECSIQRRHQKIIEESPSPALSPALRDEMAKAAVAAGEAIGYQGAGTVEFILAPNGEFYFLEVNTRLQVEHPVTEEITGLDLVELQIRVAEGQPLSWLLPSVSRCGHALECRIYAEDPARDFAPCTGKVLTWQPPTMNGLRIDSGVASGSEVSIYYDPMLAKIITQGATRAESIQRMIYALERLTVFGLTTNLGFLLQILRHSAFQSGDLDTHFIDRYFPQASERRVFNETKIPAILIMATLVQWLKRRQQLKVLTAIPSGFRNNPYLDTKTEYLLNQAQYTVQYRALASQNFRFVLRDVEYTVRLNHSDESKITAEINQIQYLCTYSIEGEQVWLQHPAFGIQMVQALPRFPEILVAVESSSEYRAQMPGKVVKIMVTPKMHIKIDQPLIILESMKMETTLYAKTAGHVAEIFVQEGQLVQNEMLLLQIEAEIEASTFPESNV